MPDVRTARLCCRLVSTGQDWTDDFLYIAFPRPGSFEAHLLYVFVVCSCSVLAYRRGGHRIDREHLRGFVHVDPQASRPFSETASQPLDLRIGTKCLARRLESRLQQRHSFSDTTRGPGTLMFNERSLPIRAEVGTRSLAVGQYDAAAGSQALSSVSRAFLPLRAHREVLLPRARARPPRPLEHDAALRLDVRGQRVALPPAPRVPRRRDELLAHCLLALMSRHAWMYIYRHVKPGLR